MFGNKLKFFRHELGLKQSEMADLLHVDTSTYCRWEHREHPSIHVIARITKTFRVNAWEWVKPMEDPAIPSPGPRVVHFQQAGLADAKDARWRTKAEDLVGRIIDLLEHLDEDPGRRRSKG